MAEASSLPARVCIITGEYPPMQGGVGDYTAILAEHLADLGLAVAVGTIREPRGESRATTDNPTVWRCTDQWGFRSLHQLSKRAADWRADVVHVQYQAAAYGMHPAVNLAGWLLRCGRRRPRVVVTMHDWKVPYLFPKAGKLRKLALLALVNSADAVIVTNAEDALSLRSSWLGRRRQSAVIPIGSNIPVDAEAPNDRHERRRSLGIADGETLLGYFGFLNRNKGVDMLLSAAATLLERGERLRVLLIGGTIGDSDPTNREYEQLIKQMVMMPVLRDAVIWSDFADKRDVSRLLQACDACVLPFRQGASFRHGSLVAAIVHGLPIVTTIPSGGRGSPGKVGGLQSLADGENALLVEAGNCRALEDAIQSLCCSPEKRAAIAAGARRLAPQFDWKAIAAQTTGLYQALLNS